MLLQQQKTNEKTVLRWSAINAACNLNTTNPNHWRLYLKMRSQLRCHSKLNSMLADHKRWYNDTQTMNRPNLQTHQCRKLRKLNCVSLQACGVHRTCMPKRIMVLHARQQWFFSYVHGNSPLLIHGPQPQNCRQIFQTISTALYSIRWMYRTAKPDL